MIGINLITGEPLLIDKKELQNTLGASDISIIDAGSYFTGTEVETALQEEGLKHLETIEPSGFTASGVAATTLSWVDGAVGVTRTFTITGDHNIYIAGVKYEKKTASIQIANTTGTHWIYYNSSGVLSESTTIPAFSSVFIATVYWNTTVGFDKGILGDDRHGLTMDWRTHELLHNTVGSRYASGLAGTFVDATFSIATGTWYDEDIEYKTVAPSTTCEILYKNGAVDYEWTTNNTVYYYTSGGNLYYNNGNVLTAAGANKYVAVWIFATSNNDRPIISIIGQNVSDTIAAARAVNTYEGLTLGNLPFQEMKLLYRVILRNDVTPYEEAQDYRNISNLPTGTYLATNHNVLTNLAWATAGHTGTVSTFAGFDATGVATNYTESNYLLVDGTRALTNCTGLPAASVVAGSLVSGMLASDHGTASTDQIVNVSYGTGEPPAANTTTEGSLFVKYTA